MLIYDLYEDLDNKIKSVYSSDAMQLRMTILTEKSGAIL